MLMLLMTPVKIASILALSCALGLLAEQYPQMTSWMKTVGRASSALKAAENKTGDEAVRNAERIAGVYENMIAFWRQRRTEDAVKWSEEGKASAVELASAAHAGDAERAAAAFTAVMQTCQSCHAAHRKTLADGRYAMK